MSPPFCSLASLPVPTVPGSTALGGRWRLPPGTIWTEVAGCTRHHIMVLPTWLGQRPQTKTMGQGYNNRMNYFYHFVTKTPLARE